MPKAVNGSIKILMIPRDLRKSPLFQRTDDGLVTIQNSGLSPWWSDHHGLMGEMSTQSREKYSLLACESLYRMVIMSMDSGARQPGFDDVSAIC